MKRIDMEKRSFVKRLFLITSTLALIALVTVLSSCDKDLEVRTYFPFELQVMPVPKSIKNGETVTIRCNIKTEGNYDGTQYYIRYFQFDGKGKLILGSENKLTLKPNDMYNLHKREFWLYYVSESNVTQAFDIWISDNHGNEQKVSFQFNNTQK